MDQSCSERPLCFGDLHTIFMSLHSLHQKVNSLMSTQALIDAVAAAVQQALTDLATSSAAIQAELNSLAAANPAVNLTALTAAVQTLDPAAKAIGALVPVATAPAPAPAPVPASAAPADTAPPPASDPTLAAVDPTVTVAPA